MPSAAANTGTMTYLRSTRFIPDLSGSMLMHDLHVRPDIAGWPQVQKHGESGRMFAVDRLELRCQPIDCGLNSQSHVQEGWANREVPLITECICLDPSDRVFLNLQRR